MKPIDCSQSICLTRGLVSKHLASFQSLAEPRHVSGMQLKMKLSVTMSAS